MQVLHTPAAVRAATAAGKITALVPTMGGLHDGHLALVKHAATLADIVLVSVYVNPLQFGANEDYSSYPRRLQEDCIKLQGIADIVYAPKDETMYPQPQTIGISLPPLAEMFCGASRPGFFQGVAAVVCKLFNQCRPHTAVFGQKDYQQAILMRQMSEQLDMEVNVFMYPTVRENSGLALSSRNEYLTNEEKQRAPILYQTLQQAAQSLQDKDADDEAICTRARRRLADAGFTNDYFAIRAADNLSEPLPEKARAVLAAAWLGKARLIDNITVHPDGTVV